MAEKRTRGSVKLTKTTVAGLKAGETITRAWDSVVPGFHVRVYPSGAKSYAVTFQRPSGAKVNVTIGSTEVHSVEEARKKAGKLRELHDDGKDARAHIKAERGARDMAALAALWKEDYKAELKPSSQRSYASIIKQLIIPNLGSRLVKDLDFGTIKEVHRKVRKAQPVGANRMITVLSRLMSIAEAEGWRPKHTNPCHKFPKPDEASRKRIFTAAELARLEAGMSALVADEKLDRAAADLFRFLALSGLRISEAANLKWTDIDEHQTTMTIRVHKTDKGGKNPKTLPLNPPLREILARRAQERLSAFVFPGLKADAPLVGLRKMWLRVLEVEGIGLVDVTPHDLRRTFMTTCTELGYPPSIGDTLLGHSLGKITDIYTHLSMDGILSAASTDTALWIAAAMRGKNPKTGTKIEPAKKKKA